MISLMSSNLERWHARSLFLNKQLDNDLEVRNDLGRKKINSNIQPTNYFKAKISFKFCSLTFVWTNFNFKFSELYISSFPRVPSKFFKILDLHEPEKPVNLEKSNQNFFQEAQQGKFDPDPLDFTRTFEEIVHNRTFKTHLPQCIHNSKAKRERETDKAQPTKKPRGEVVRNSKVFPDWRIRPDEKYKDVFHPHTSKIPKRNGKQICCKMQTLGHCNSSCNFDHDKIERGSKTFGESDKFVKSCREGNF